MEEGFGQAWRGERREASRVCTVFAVLWGLSACRAACGGFGGHFARDRTASGQISVSRGEGKERAESPPAKIHSSYQREHNLFVLLP